MFTGPLQKTVLASVANFPIYDNCMGAYFYLTHLFHLNLGLKLCIIKGVAT